MIVQHLPSPSLYNRVGKTSLKERVFNSREKSSYLIQEFFKQFLSNIKRN